MSVRAVRGTRDLLPEETSRWQLIENQARGLSQQYGYREIRTPLFEKAELFVRGMGVLAGLVERELWTFHDKFGQKLALRADVTASVVRAYYENNLEKNGGIQKFYYIAPVFLIGRETEEGSRQAHQFGVEAMGSPHAAQDAEVIALAWAFCKKVGLSDVVFELNSLGCDKCRPAYHDALKEYFSAHSNELCGTCKRKHKTHPLWTLGCSEKTCVELSQVAPTMFGLLCPACKQHFNQLKAYLTEMKLPHELNPRVVRDLEYYNRTIFQVKHGDTVIGTGGRYDGLVETLGGPDTPAVGFAMHLENLVESLPEAPSFPTPSVFLRPEGDEATRLLMPVLNVLREAGIYAEMTYDSEEPPEGPRFLVSLSEKDASRGVAQVHDRQSDHKDRYNLSELAHRLASRLGLGSLVAVGERPQREDREERGRGRRGERDRERGGRSERGTRRNGALRGRHFNVESDLEVHYDQPDPAPAEKEDSESSSRTKRRRRRRGGGEDDAPVAAASRTSTQDTYADSDREEAGGSRSRRRRRSRGERDEATSSSARRETSYERDPRYDDRVQSRYHDDYDRDRDYYREEAPREESRPARGRTSRSTSSRSGRSRSTQDTARVESAYRDRDGRERDYYREESSYRDRNVDRERGGEYRDQHEPSVERAAYDEPRRGRSRGRGRSEAAGAYEDDYRREEPAPAPRYDDYYDEPRQPSSSWRSGGGGSRQDYDDGPQPVDSKLALLESSRAASATRYRSSDEGGDGRRRSRSGGGGRSSSASSGGGSRRRRSSGSRGSGSRS